MSSSFLDEHTTALASCCHFPVTSCWPLPVLGLDARGTLTGGITTLRCAALQPSTSVFPLGGMSMISSNDFCLAPLPFGDRDACQQAVVSFPSMQ